MTAVDILIFLILAIFAALGFSRGFVQEAFALVAWAFAFVAVRVLHEPVTDALLLHVGNASGAAVVALALVFGITFALARWFASFLGERVRSSVLGPVDRVLGFGFGALKALMLVTIVYVFYTLVYSVVWPSESKPAWLLEARSYPLLNASGNALSEFIQERRAQSTASEISGQ